MHYVWAVGDYMGERVDSEHADILLCQPGFNRHNLQAVFREESLQLDSESIELQKILGGTKVDEYGTFVDKSRFM